jgi:hypothetical protein
LSLWEAAAGDLGRLTQVTVDASGRPSVTDGGSVARRRFTPAAGAKTYSVRGWRTAGAFTVNAGAGGAATYVPGYMLIRRDPMGA